MIAAADLVENSSTRAQFSMSVLQRTVTAIKNYWEQQVFSGRDVPPVEKQNDEDVVAFVKSNAGAIGYVGAAAHTEGVKVIAVTE